MWNDNGILSAYPNETTYRRFHDQINEEKNEYDDLIIDRNGFKKKKGSSVMLIIAIGCILFFLMMYIPVYKQVNGRPECHMKCWLLSILTHRATNFYLDQNSLLNSSSLHANSTLIHQNLFEKLWSSSRKGSVAGWSYNTSRNTRKYVFPDNVTLLNQPKSICKLNKDINSQSMEEIDKNNNKPEIFLLVIICSKMENFNARSAIRDTWGNHSNYLKLAKRFENVTQKFHNGNITDKMITDLADIGNFTLLESRVKRHLTKKNIDNDYDYSDEKQNSNISLYDFQTFNSNTVNTSDINKPSNMNNYNNKININRIFYNREEKINYAQGQTNIPDDGREILKENYNKRKIWNSINRKKRSAISAKRDVFSQSLANKKNTDPKEDVSNDVYDDPRFDHSTNKNQDENIKDDGSILGNFEGTQKSVNVDYYDYYSEPSNIMKIPPRKKYSPNSDNVKAGATNDNFVKLTFSDEKLKLELPPSNNVKIKKSHVSPIRTKFVFLLGQSLNENNTDLQSRIDEEATLYDDIIQEGFIDSYNNLTLKSVMLLKWVVSNCGNNVHYIMKTDDDMYVNIPRLIEALHNKTKEHVLKSIPTPTGSTKKSGEIYNEIPETKKWEIIQKEKLLMGDLICEARPISDISSKWYSPTYMYGGKVYPRYLSGTGYVMSFAAASALYKAALDTPLFHLEDIYITGICSQRAGIKPIDHPGFSYAIRKFDPCIFAYLITAHQMSPMHIRRMHNILAGSSIQRLEACEVKKVLSMKNSSMLTNIKDSLLKLNSPILGSPRNFINGLIGLGIADAKITKLGSVSNKHRKKLSNGCF